MKRGRAVYVVEHPDLTTALEWWVPDGRTLYHRFLPQGESMARVGSEVTVVVHTWPEHGRIAVDVVGASNFGAFEEALGWTRVAEPVGAGT